MANGAGTLIGSSKILLIEVSCRDASDALIDVTLTQRLMRYGVKDND